jgi:hypothetical protein
MTPTLAKERATLIALLQDMPLGPLPKITGIAKLDTRDKLFLLSTCCAQMIAEAVWCQSGANRASALLGIDSLVLGIKDNINRRIDGEL